MKAPTSCAGCTNSFCASLSESSREKIFKKKYWHVYTKKNQQLFYLENRQVLIIETGVLIPFRTDEIVKHQSIDVLGPGDLLGIVNLFKRDDRDCFSVLPLTSCTGCLIPTAAMEQLAMENPDISRAIIAEYSLRYSRLVDNLTNKTLSGSKERLAHALHLLEEKGISHASHEDLALLSGLNRVTVTRTIHQLNKQL